MSVKVCNEKNWDETVDVERLSKIKPQSLGPRHKPVCHGDVLKMFKERMEDNGITVVGERGLLSDDRLKYVYVADVYDEDVDDYTFTLGFVNYNNKKKALAGITGERVAVCSNENYIGEDVNDRKRHTNNIGDRLFDKCENIIDKFTNFKKVRAEEIKQMQATPFTDENMGNVVLSLLRKSVISNTDVARIVKEYDEPSYKEFSHGTAWCFLNACTTVLKKTENPLRRMEICRDIRDAIQKELA